MPTLAGKFAFACSQQDRCNIWSYDPLLDELQPVTAGDSWKDQPDWSPCGNWVTYLCDSSGCPEIFKIAVSGSVPSEPIALTSRNQWCDSPRFSPDGQRIAFVSSGFGPSQIWMMDSDGGNLRPITNEPTDCTHVEWLSDGQSMIWSRHGTNGNADICRMNVNDGRVQTLSQESSTDVAPAISPCGKFVAYLSNRQVNSRSHCPYQNRCSDVWLMRSDGRDPVKLTNNQNCVGSLTWHPSGAFLFFLSRDVAAPPRLRQLNVADLGEALQAEDTLRIINAADLLRTASQHGALPDLKLNTQGTVRSPRWQRPISESHASTATQAVELAAS